MGKIKGKVNSLIAKYKTRDVFELCDYLGIHIKYDIIGSVKGYFFNDKGIKIITLNYNLDDWEIKVVLAHELGHAILHEETNICFLKNYTFFNENKAENEANEFASHLLISDEELREFSIGKDSVCLESISSEFNVPIELVVYKKI